MASKVSIASNALLMLGAKPINSFEESMGDNLDRARIVANIYPTVRDDVLRSHPWNCATKRVTLSPLTPGPAFGWSAQFALPSDWLRTLSIGDEYAGVRDFAMEGRRILANANILSLRYIAVIDESVFDAALVGAMEVTLAARIAYAITSSAAVAEAMERKAELAMRRARAVNGQEDTGDDLGDDGFGAARMGGYWSRSGR